MQWLVHKIEPSPMTTNTPPQQPAALVIEQALHLAIAQHQAGQIQEAENLYRTILKIHPGHPDANHNMGVLAVQTKQPTAGLPHFLAALEADPTRRQYWLSYIDALFQANQLETARQVLAHAQQQGLQGDEVEALAARLKSGTQIDNQADTEHPNIFKESLPAPLNTSPGGKKKFKALSASNKVKKPRQQEAKALTALFSQGRLTEAENLAKKMTLRFPLHGLGWKVLGAVFHLTDRSTDALDAMKKAAVLSPNDAEAHSNLGVTLNDLGRLSEAEVSYRRAIQINPNHPWMHSNLLFNLSHNTTVDAETLFSEHRQFSKQFETHFLASYPQFAQSRDPDRPLQIGFVSGDFCNHAVANFIEPVLAHLSGYPQLSLHAYSNHGIEDAVTQRIRAHFAYWHPISSLSDAALAKKIRADGIDILIDLSGHSSKNRLLTFAQKPAPVQASWIGYPGTTGLRAMDYYLADRFFLPPGQFDNQFTEKIVHLPAGAPFLPSEHAPPVNILPALSNGYVTFGSFNRISKLSRSVIALWSQLLRALPDSRMLLGGMPEDGQYDTLIEWFAQDGITRERLNFHARSGMDTYLTLHQQVDICLDTFPYNGGTTTLHALWMGVPTLTLAGSTVAGRPGAAILGHAGLEAFIAHDVADFVQKGLSWAGDLAALADIRAGLRERFSKSAMGQPDVVAAGVERALRIMWQRWCADLPAESFEVSLQDIDNTAQGTRK